MMRKKGETLGRRRFTAFLGEKSGGKDQKLETGVFVPISEGAKGVTSIAASFTEIKKKAKPTN